LIQNRELFIDQLRGFALLGIAVANVGTFAHSKNWLISGPNHSVFNQFSELIKVVMFDGKFILLFCFLFGYSFIHTWPTDAAQSPIRYRNRMVCLIAIGAFHAAFLFLGDILAFYGALGLIVIRWRKKSVPQLMKRVQILFGLALAIELIGLITSLTDQAPFKPSSWTAELFQASNVAAQGTWFSAIKARLSMWSLGTSLSIFFGYLSYAAVAFGIIAQKSQWLSAQKLNDPIWQTIRVWGTPVAAVLMLVLGTFRMWPSSGLAAGQGNPVFSTVAFVITPLLSLVYVAWLAHLCDRQKRFADLLANAGSMSLSCYLLQSVCFAFVFSNWGLGAFDRLNPAAQICLAIAVWLFGVYFAKYWLLRHRRGPVEQLMHWFLGPSISRPLSIPHSN
jgi:uncharacterized protein